MSPAWRGRSACRSGIIGARHRGTAAGAYDQWRTVKAFTYAPSEIFGHHIRYVIPLFQRPYVWNEELQWAPLWADVAGVADAALTASTTAYGAPPVAPHFLGAIVVEASTFPTGYIAVKHVVDGQQRLTTLQLLTDAAQQVVLAQGDPRDAAGLRKLIHNDVDVAQDPSEVYKVWPTDVDQAAFRAAMDDDAVLDSEQARTPIGKAHTFFVEQASAWAHAQGPDQVTNRLRALSQTLHSHLKLVVIDLEPEDNAQVIFETLNHRGVELMAADLVKNLVFQVADRQRQDLRGLYDHHWKALDSDYWRAKISQGRLFRPRIDVFLQHWLTMRLREPVPADRIFTVFRDSVVKVAKPDMVELIRELAADAAVYASFETLSTTSVEGRFYYRVIRAMDSGVVSPFLLWVLRHGERISTEQRHRALQAVESWLVRRALVRATAKQVNLTMLDLLRAVTDDDVSPGEVGTVTEAFLAGQTSDSRYWPDDAAVARSLATEPLYTALVRARVRMILEALEDELRSSYGEGQPCPRNLTVEHVLPQGWREHWGADVEGDIAAQIQRDRVLHTLGNLTLVSGRLNPALSNRPWTDQDAVTRGVTSGKRSRLLEHSELKLNAELVAHEIGWTEADIAARAQRLAQVLTHIWPRPADAATPPGQMPTEVDPGPVDSVRSEEDFVVTSGHAGKYQALWAWLSDQVADDIPVTFNQVEEILGMDLPPSARNYLPHWYGYEGTALGRAIRDAGWKASGVNLTSERLTFVRDAGTPPG